MIKRYLTKSNIGLSLNSLGSILMALAIDVPPVNDKPGWLDFTSGTQFNFVTINHPWYLKIGLILLIVGFIIQLERKPTGSEI